MNDFDEKNIKKALKDETREYHISLTSTDILKLYNKGKKRKKSRVIISISLIIVFLVAVISLSIFWFLK